MGRLAMEDDKEMYEAILRVSKNTDIIYESIQGEIEEKQHREGFLRRTQAQQLESSS